MFFPQIFLTEVLGNNVHFYVFQLKVTSFVVKGYPTCPRGIRSINQQDLISTTANSWSLMPQLKKFWSLISFFSHRDSENNILQYSSNEGDKTSCMVPQQLWMFEPILLLSQTRLGNSLPKVQVIVGESAFSILYWSSSHITFNAGEKLPRNSCWPLLILIRASIYYCSDASFFFTLWHLKNPLKIWWYNNVWQRPF